ncbi:glycosyltransferase [Erythrobacter rubeus]|uniref:Glycosyltransferase n=1 Tax=Erythrobacter rubeus TaxID=2760803 RepID=A0ABR8KNS0_9SPHN|nr:glycosyltransferase [Erythrobacter rubeus]MBD2841035.1 glycosyltransferase [Erythrobacter rubeus]
MISGAELRGGEGDHRESFEWLQREKGVRAGLSAQAHAPELDHLLWRGYHGRVLPRLEALLDHGPAVERASAGWVLARWYSEQGDLEKARQAILAFHSQSAKDQLIAHPGPYLLAVELCLDCGDAASAELIFEQGIARFGETNDFRLARFLLAKAKGETVADLSAILSDIYFASELAEVVLGGGNGHLFDRLRGGPSMARREGAPDDPLVSIIVPVFNAARELSTAIKGLQAQSWENLEILLVNDGSSDDSLAIASAAAAHDERLRIIDLGKNQGAYPARNTGFAEARGKFVTVHDSDDWSHPQKIEQQVQPLIADRTLKATVSHWVRAGNNIEMTRWRMEEGWIYRNVSSLMIRAELREQLGYWDRVKVNADTEYYYRIRSAFGANSIKEVCPGVPLAFARTLPESLTNQSATHLRTQFAGVRRDYMESAHVWHETADNVQGLRLARHPAQRPFRVPNAITLGDPEGPEGDYDLLTASHLLDEQWYQLAYPDVLQSGMSAARHYLKTGAKEGRDPGPLFSTSAYREANQLGSAVNPLLHHHREQGIGNTSGLPNFEGALADLLPETKTVLVFAHTAGKTLFGAERSFLDVVARLVRGGFAPVVVAPSMPSEEYLGRLLEISAAVEILPQIWRSGLHPVNSQTVEAIRSLIVKYRPAEVHVNTVVLEAPLLAARAESVPSVMYVRELPAEDMPLCRALSMSPEALRLQLLEQADRFIMPSESVREWLGCPERCTVRPNAVDPSLFDLPYDPGHVLRIALISSNIEKKGVREFVAAARTIAWMGQPVRFLIFGPQTPDLLSLSPLPPNVEVMGYAPRPIDAIDQADVIVSLSKFAESFGRTVVEAMAAGRPVICYDRGAPPSLAVSGETGFVIPADSVSWIVDAVLALDASRLQLRKMSRAARRRAHSIQKLALASSLGRLP